MGSNSIGTVLSSIAPCSWGVRACQPPKPNGEGYLQQGLAMTLSHPQVREESSSYTNLGHKIYCDGAKYRRPLGWSRVTVSVQLSSFPMQRETS